jgi:hypothetical protein
MLTSEATKGSPIGNPFDFHSKLHLLSPQYDAGEAPYATLSLFTSLFACLATMRGNREPRMENITPARCASRGLACHRVGGVEVKEEDQGYTLLHESMRPLYWSVPLN